MDRLACVYPTGKFGKKQRRNRNPAAAGPSGRRVLTAARPRTEEICVGLGGSAPQTNTTVSSQWGQVALAAGFSHYYCCAD